MEKLAEIRAEATALAGKKSWLKQGLATLLEKMSKEVIEVESDFQVDAELAVGVNGQWETRTYILRLETQHGAFFEVKLVRHFDDSTESVESIHIEDLPSCVVRDIATHIPDAVEGILSQLQNLNSDYQKAVEVLQNLLDKLC